MFLAHRKDEQLKPGNGPVRGSLFHSKYVFVATNFKEISRNEEIETSNAFWEFWTCHLRRSVEVEFKMFDKHVASLRADYNSLDLRVVSDAMASCMDEPLIQSNFYYCDSWNYMYRLKKALSSSLKISYFGLKNVECHNTFVKKVSLSLNVIRFPNPAFYISKLYNMCGQLQKELTANFFTQKMFK